MTRQPFISNPVRNARKDSGTIFVTTMWVTIVLVAMVLVFARSMRVEVIASGNRLCTDEAAAVELGAEQYVLAQVDNTDGDADPILNAEGEAVPVGDGYFWLLRPAADESSFDFGISDEAAKVNVNIAQPVQLVQLPGMTNEAADSIVDWVDPDENPTNGDGAESQYYLGLQEPYRSKNSAFETVGELRLVKGIDDQVLYGMDVNHNGVVDPGEQTRGQSLGRTSGASSNGSSPDRGIFPFVTVYSIDPAVGSTGTARVNVNEQTATGATPQAPGQSAAPGKAGAAAPVAVAAPPQAGKGNPAGATPGAAGGNNLSDPLAQALQQGGLSTSRITQIMQQVQSKRPFSNLFDFARKVGLSAADLRQVADRLTARQGNSVGLINVNNAPREVLLTLPGLTEGDVDALIGQRERSDTTSIAWVAEAMTMDKAASIGSLITNRSFFYSADIVAVSGDGRAFKRVRIVVDARQTPPKIIYRKDLTSLGWPLPKDIRDSLRSGKGPGQSVQGTIGRMGAK